MFARISKDDAYLRMAIAMSQRSTCLDKQVGCVITNIRSKVIATGYNGAPRGHTHCIDCHTCWKELYENPSKCPSAHAEQNALLQCTNVDDIHTVYLTLSPCIVCIRMLMNTTAQRIVFINEHRHPEPKEMWVNAGKEWIQHGI